MSLLKQPYQFDYNENSCLHSMWEVKYSIKRDRSLFFFFSVFLGPHPWHMEVPRLGVKLELQLPATTMWNPSRICDVLGSLTHWARPGIEPATSWSLVSFVSAAPRWELQDPLLIQMSVLGKASVVKDLWLETQVRPSRQTIGSEWERRNGILWKQESEIRTLWSRVRRSWKKTEVS